jgi:caspase domain-containing protein
MTPADAMHALVTDDLITIGENDSLVIFYAGHGGTRTHLLGGTQIKTGYLVPVDAANSPNKVASWIDLNDWLRKVSLLPAKHVLVILDACYSGIALDSILKWRDVASWHSAPLATLVGRRSRRIITAALDNQLARDSGPIHGHSLFTGCLIEGLSGALAQSGSAMTTGSALGLYVQKSVQEYPSSQQTPDFGAFDFDERGEMVIPLLTAEQPPEPVESAPPHVRLPRKRWIAVGIGVLVAASVLIMSMRAGDELAALSRCPPPMLDPDQVWAPAMHAGLGKQTIAAALLDREIAAWGAAHVAACKVEPIARAPRLLCLDGVLARIDTVARAARTARDGLQSDAGALLIDPQVCELPRAPRLTTSTSPEFREVVTTWLAHTATPVPLEAAAASALVARAAADPCGSSLAHLLAADI